MAETSAIHDRSHGSGQAPRRIRQSRRSGPRRSQAVGALWAAPALIMVLIFFVVPVVYMVYMSFQNWPLLGDHEFVGLRNYTDAIHDPRFLEPVKFTILYTVLIVPALLVAGLGMASLVKAKRRGSGVFRTLFFLPVVVGFAAAGYLWLWFVNPRVGPLPQILRDLGFGSLQDPWLGPRPVPCSWSASWCSGSSAASRCCCS